MVDEAFVKKLQNEQDFTAYLRLLKQAKEQFVIFVAVNDTGAGPGMTEAAASEFMVCLGLKTNLFDKYRRAYAAIIDRGTVVREILQPDLAKHIALSGKCNGKDFKVLSSGYECTEIPGAQAVISFDGINYSPDSRGINFVVFDVEKNIVADASSFDSYANLESGKPYALVDSMKKIRHKIGAKIGFFKLPNTPPETRPA